MASLIAFIRADLTADAPVTPGSWTRQLEDNRWTTLYPLGRGGVFFRARLIARASGNPGRAVFVCTGQPAVIQRLADAIASDGLPWTQTWATLGALRADAGATATAIQAAWPDERPRDAAQTPIGVLVALYARMAGFTGEDAET